MEDVAAAAGLLLFLLGIWWTTENEPKQKRDDNMKYWECCGCTWSGGFEVCPRCGAAQKNKSKKKRHTGRQQRDLEAEFLAYWKQLAPGAPLPAAQYKFHPSRKWAFDWAWPEQKLAVEIDGGMWVRGAHNRPAGIHNDNQKRNAALLLGWRVLVFDTLYFDDPVGMVEQLRALLELERV